MSKYHIGDTFKIEIAETYRGAESGNDKYRIKGFDNLVFDDKGLRRLEQFNSQPDNQRKFRFGDIVSTAPFNDDRYYVVVNAAPDRLVGVTDDNRTPFFLDQDSMVVIDRADADIVIKYINGEIGWAEFNKHLLEGC